MARERTVWGVLVVAIALVAAACSSGDDATSSGDDASGSAASPSEATTAVTTVQTTAYVAPDVTAETPPPTVNLGSFSIHTCINIAEGVASNVGFRGFSVEADFVDPVTGLTGLGCETTYTVAVASYADLAEVLATIRSALVHRGWLADPAWDTEGSDTFGLGFRADASLCLVDVSSENADGYIATMNCIDDLRGSSLPSLAAGSLVPLEETECSAIADVMFSVVALLVDTRHRLFENQATGETGMGCETSLAGAREGTPAVAEIGAGIVEGMRVLGWEEDPAVGATAGPGYFGTGFIQGAKVCSLLATWGPFDLEAGDPMLPFSEWSVSPSDSGVGVSMHCAQSG